MTTTNKYLNQYLNNKRIPKYYYDDLTIVIEEVGFNKIILDWFSYLHNIETVGWRPKFVTQKIARILANSDKDNPVEFYSLYCPSYKKGVGLHGFRTDDVGDTTKWGIKILKQIVKKTILLGIPCKLPRAIFFDIAIEQSEKTIKEIVDLKININNFKKYLPNNIKFELLSELFPAVFDTVGYWGIKMSPPPVSQTTLNRIIERGGKFYQLFGWDDKQIKERSLIIASSEALVGNTIRYAMPNSIMIYTPTMLERAQVYSGFQYKTDPLPIIFPKHND
jgi:hypothetical protein